MRGEEGDEGGEMAEGVRRGRLKNLNVEIPSFFVHGVLGKAHRPLYACKLYPE